jgi:hypothetical protein
LPGSVLVVCKDLFFTARIGETAKLAGAPSRTMGGAIAW